MDRFSRRLQGKALQRLAILSEKEANSDTDDDSTFERLSSECTPRHVKANGFAHGVNKQLTETSQIPMSLRELEVLLALCKAAPSLQTSENARKLVQQLSPYLIESFDQRFAPSPFLRDVEPSPWECLTASLTTALLSIGLKFAELRLDICNTFITYTNKILAASESRAAEDDETSLASLVASFVGFLESAAKLAKFWSPAERLALLSQARRILSERFLLNVEATFTTIRNTQRKGTTLWKRYARYYESIGRPLGAMLLQCGLTKYLVASTSLVVTKTSMRSDDDVLNVLLDGSVVKSISPEDFAAVGTYAEVAVSIITMVDDGAAYVDIDTERGQQLTFAVKAHALSAYCHCVVLSNSADPNVLYRWLQSTIGDPVQMANVPLATAALKILAVLAKDDNNSESGFISVLHRFIIEGTPNAVVVEIAAKCLSDVLQHSSQDAMITTLNTMGHVLSSANPERALKAETLQPFEQQAMGSSLSLVSSSDEFRHSVYCNAIATIAGVAKSCKEKKMISLAQTILIQRLHKVNGPVNAKILTALATLAPISNSTDFKSILEEFNKASSESVWHDDQAMIDSIMEARIYMSKSITRDSLLYDMYLANILEVVGSVGDDREQDEEKKQVDAVLAVREIEQYIPPLAVLLRHNGTDKNFALKFGFTGPLRDFWFNCIIHGIYYGSEISKKYLADFKAIAQYTPPLIAGANEDESFDTNLDENSLLKRKMTPQHTVEHKRRLMALLPHEEAHIKTLSFARAVYLEAAYSLECLRAEAGGCSKVLAYFVEPAFKTGEGSAIMTAIAGAVSDVYISHIISGIYPEFSASSIADQLADVFVGCCHRLEKVQKVAVSIADRIIATVPSALCRRPSLFALLELLTLMWVSCLEKETDEYATKSLFTSERGRVTIEVPDSFDFRERTLANIRKLATTWVTKVLNIAPLDLKGLLQTYLSEFEEEESLGHISVGRSFALEMGGVVPNTDQRLASINQLGGSANIASDFVKQYTVRQTYRTSESMADNIRNTNFLQGAYGLKSSPSTNSIQDLIKQMKGTDYAVERVAVEDVKDMLRMAATRVCASQKGQGTLIRSLISIPFEVFTETAIKQGILLWTGIMNERPHLQPRMLAEIARNFEMTVERKMGIFAESFNIYDAFEVKMEYAPSDKEQHTTEQQTALDLFSPHLRLLQLVSSSFHANRHGNPHIQKIFLRLVRVALKGLKTASGHPLAREARFQLVLFGLQVLRYSSRMTDKQQTSLKDLIISAGLSWFKFTPRWSFGGIRLQVKAEAHLLQDVANLLNAVSKIGENSQALRLKQDLLLLLVENEQYRLATWLYPLEHSRRHHLPPGYSARPVTDNAISVVLPAAWTEDPAIAVHLYNRFQSPTLKDNIKRYILNYPEKVVDIPDAAQIMLGDKLSAPLTFQLRYLLFWKPVNPITATTYFLPAYCNDSFILQYAMRSLESHSVDVTFFYVPQIVQTLRYDALGYVERFILETAKFSQLFAHQIIWNMKANAYKDEESQIPDPVKPTLDHVMGRLVDSFSGADKSFYEREFVFFNEVTSISGKLRPYIRKTKPEKNQKIAEELQKIKVDVGVYLPSNPDSVVIDIDRNSGKSLQSHAKAPFMASFKIRRKAAGGMNESQPLDRQGHRHESTSTVTKEMVQAAIFKVGDDCRQDMLALQLIATFRSIFNSVGLDVFVFPYRVTATAPGCGVIDVLPKSISRDMLGRDYDMGLYDYFVSKYGGEDSIKFQEARNCFVKSMAAYSVISYLLKFKDRHNGNIMLDDAGHIIHIDFGFCFDIAPGGITFERAPFKLTAEMVSVMGGSTESQPYLWFEELCIKSFLVCRQYVDKLTHCVVLMLDSGLPCFKPETIQNFRDRFVLEKTDREAADYMRYLVKRSYSSYSTGQYDRFQHLTNGIPY
ncbi:hypothetical protein EDC01DRAFT_303291 [Geopyxis carbonaria]|nr:hypothetical protein EDC01DRAFT_303291 [Geopyxis carbonaria]